jgi:integrase
MGTITKRVLPSGLVRWRAAYTDGASKRRTKQFARKADADAWLVEVRHDVARGTHTAASASPTGSGGLFDPLDRSLRKLASGDWR